MSMVNKKIALVIGMVIIIVIGVVVFRDGPDAPVMYSDTRTADSAATTTDSQTGEYLGFDIVTFRHDPTYYDETEEYVDIRWLGPGTVNLKGYVLTVINTGVNEYQYTFPSVTLKVDEMIRVHSRAGAGKYNFGASGEIWEDDNSSVRLYSPNEHLEAYYGE